MVVLNMGVAPFQKMRRNQHASARARAGAGRSGRLRPNRPEPARSGRSPRGKATPWRWCATMQLAFERGQRPCWAQTHHHQSPPATLAMVAPVCSALRLRKARHRAQLSALAGIYVNVYWYEHSRQRYRWRPCSHPYRIGNAHLQFGQIMQSPLAYCTTL